MLDISRKDIIGTEIMEFDAASRFIKLPIAHYLELLGTTPNSAQIALINGFLMFLVIHCVFIYYVLIWKVLN